MSDPRKGLTLRAIVLGLGMVVFVDVWATYKELLEIWANHSSSTSRGNPAPKAMAQLNKGVST